MYQENGLPPTSLLIPPSPLRCVMHHLARGKGWPQQIQMRMTPSGVSQVEAASNDAAPPPFRPPCIPQPMRCFRRGLIEDTR